MRVSELISQIQNNEMRENKICDKSREVNLRFSDKYSIFEKNLSDLYQLNMMIMIITVFLNFSSWL